jgi:hypothetical protein
MELMNVLIGLLFIGLGFIIKSFPNLIAGYNTMPAEKKKNVDIEGLSSFMRNGFISMGLVLIAGYYLFRWLGSTMIANSMILIVTLTGVTVLVIKAQNFDHNKNRKFKPACIAIALVILFVTGLISYGLVPPKTTFNNSAIKFSGMYGFEIEKSEISGVDLIDSLPAIKLRTNGFSLGLVNKGFFNLDGYGKTRLLINSGTSPFLKISKNNGETIIINFKDKSETEDVYNKIQAMIK